MNGIVRPVPEQSAWNGDFRYLLGDALLVDALGVGDGPRRRRSARVRRHDQLSVDQNTSGTRRLRAFG